MARFKDSFVAEIKNALSVNIYTANDFIISFSGSEKILLEITFKYKEQYYFYLRNDEDEIGNQILHALFSPGEFEASDRVRLRSYGNITDQIRSWVRLVDYEVRFKMMDINPFREIETEVLKELDKEFSPKEHPEEAFSSNEIENIKNKLKGLYEEIGSLREELSINKTELSRIKKELDQLAAASTMYPKGVWYGVAKSRIASIFAGLYGSRLGRIASEEVVKGAVKKLIGSF